MLRNPPLFANMGELCYEVGKATFEILAVIFNILDIVVVDAPAHACPPNNKSRSYGD